VTAVTACELKLLLKIAGAAPQVFYRREGCAHRCFACLDTAFKRASKDLTPMSHFIAFASVALAWSAVFAAFQRIAI